MGRKKIPKCSKGTDKIFLVFTFQDFFLQFFLIEDVYLIAFSKILSENVQNEKKKVVTQASWVPSPSWTSSSHIDRKIISHLYCLFISRDSSCLTCAWQLHTSRSQVVFSKSALRYRLCSMHISGLCFTQWRGKTNVNSFATDHARLPYCSKSPSSGSDSVQGIAFCYLSFTKQQIQFSKQATLLLSYSSSTSCAVSGCEIRRLYISSRSVCGFQKD